MITESTFKGCKSIELENDYVKVIVLPTIGGKIASFFLKDKNFELMFQNKEEIYRKAKLYDDFQALTMPFRQLIARILSMQERQLNIQTMAKFG